MRKKRNKAAGAERLPSFELPPELVGRVRSFERRLRRAETLLGLAGVALGLPATYALLLVSDRFWNTPVLLRILLPLAGGAILGWLFFRWGRHWLWRRPSMTDLARLIQQRCPQLGDRLQGAIELAGSHESPSSMSPALCRAAIRQVSREAGSYDFASTVSTRRATRLAAGAAVLLAALAALLLLFPRAAYNAWLRWSHPVAAVERYTFTTIAGLAPERVVPHGEPFEVTCTVTSSRRWWRPLRALARIGSQQAIASRIRASRAAFVVPGQIADGELTVRAGDATAREVVRPLHRPELLGLRAQVRFPDYLGRPPREIPVQEGRVPCLEGSTVTLSGKASRALRTVTLSGAPGGEPCPVADDTFSTAPREVSAPAEASLSWTDRYGLACAEPLPIRFSPSPDEPPAVRFRDLPPGVALLRDENLTLRVAATDDFGLRGMWLEWEALRGADADPAAAPSARRDLAEGQPDAAELEAEYVFSPAELGLAEGTTLRMVARARDYLPSRAPVTSEVHTIYILSAAEHAELLLQRLQNIQADLEELTRGEEDLREQNRQLAGQEAEKMAGKETERALRANERSEHLDAERLSALADQTADLTREAARNLELPAQLPAEWAELARRMAELAAQPMPAAAAKLGSAARSAEQREGDLADALELENQILEALHEMEAGMNNSFENAVARNFVNRLRQAAREEQTVAGDLEGLLPRTIGLAIDRVEAVDRARLDRMAGRQDGTRTAVEYIRDDLKGFFTRTRLEPYEDVFKAMEKANILGTLSKTAELIRGNLGSQATENLRGSAEQLEAWARALEQQPPPGGEGSPGEMAPMSPELMELIVGLERARQREEALRERTRIVGRATADEGAYAEGCERLASTQKGIADDTTALSGLVPHPAVNQLIDAAVTEMRQAETRLGGRQADADAIAIETVVIEMLSQAMSQPPCTSPGAAALLAALQGASPMGGGNPGGGGGAPPSQPPDGLAGGRDPDARNVEHVAGADTAAVSEEFRGLLEAYRRAVEDTP